MDEAVQLEIGDDGVAHLTLNRPDASNAIDARLAGDLADAAARLSGATDVRAVLLTGAGERFCAGGDVRTFANPETRLDEVLRGIIAPLHAAIVDLAELDAPVVAAVQGSAAGAGLALVAGADYVLAAQSAKLVMAYTAIGLVPDGGSTWYLARVVGLRRATELALMNRALSAEEACDWGLVNRVVADADLTPEARDDGRRARRGSDARRSGARSGCCASRWRGTSPISSRRRRRRWPRPADRPTAARAWPRSWRSGRRGSPARRSRRVGRRTGERLRDRHPLGRGVARRRRARCRRRSRAG